MTRDELLVYKMKASLINPLKAFELIASIQLPDIDVPYLSAIYGSLEQVFSAIFVYDDKSVEVMDKILAKCNIQDSNLINANLSKNYVAVYNKCEKYLDSYYSRVTSRMINDDNVKNVMLNYRRLLPNIDISETTMRDEVTFTLPYMSKPCVYNITHILFHNIVLILDTMFNRKRSDNMKITEFEKDDNGGVDIKISKLDTIKIKDSQEENYKELRKNVNKFDKDNGVDLKSPKYMPNTKEDLDNLIAINSAVINNIILILNGITTKNSVKKSKMLNSSVKNIKLSKWFVKKSIWFNSSDNDETLQYKCQFITRLAIWIISNLRKAASICYEINNYSKNVKYDIQCACVIDICSHLVNVINNTLRGKTLKDDMVYFIKVMSYMNVAESGDIRKTRKKLKNIDEQSDLLELRFNKLMSHSDEDVTVNTLFKVSYLLSTYKKSAKNKISFIDRYTLSNKDYNRRLLEELGSNIINDSAKGNNLMPLFKFFILSDPVIYTKHVSVTDNVELSAGIVALEYTKIIIGTQFVTRAIDVII